MRLGIAPPHRGRPGSGDGWCRTAGAPTVHRGIRPGAASKILPRPSGRSRQVPTMTRRRPNRQGARPSRAPPSRGSRQRRLDERSAVALKAASRAQQGIVQHQAQRAMTARRTQHHVYLKRTLRQVSPTQTMHNPASRTYSARGTISSGGCARRSRNSVVIASCCRHGPAIGCSST